MRLLALLFIVFTSQVTSAGWITEVLSQDDHFAPGRAVVMFSPDQQAGTPTFGVALKQLADSGHVHRLELITLHWFLRESPTFQQEIFSMLEQSAATQLAEAISSAGNMHNPKMVVLSNPFDTALLATPTIQGLDQDLQAVGLRIISVSHEKLMLLKDKEQHRFDAMVWLTVEKR